MEFINRNPRYCLYLADCPPHELAKMPRCIERIDAVREFRRQSQRETTRRLAETPLRFGTEDIPTAPYLIIPKVSSERRRYLPIGYMSPDSLSSDLLFVLTNASLYRFGVLTSSARMAWMRAVGGRLKSDYRYSRDIVYNNFPWSEPTSAQKKRIEETAQHILDVRAKHSTDSYAELYNPSAMPGDLLEAHKANDRAVPATYGFHAGRRRVTSLAEPEIVARLLSLYEKLVQDKNE